jgi:hypothetical protein
MHVVSDCEDVDVIMVPVRQIIPEFQELCGEKP